MIPPCWVPVFVAIVGTAPPAYLRKTKTFWRIAGAGQEVKESFISFPAAFRRQEPSGKRRNHFLSPKQSQKKTFSESFFQKENRLAHGLLIPSREVLKSG
ncbi:hypothetical protein [Deinococcus aluminii]|uniref:hypothetical protein n=1 Tax=Deinococcus aluminii TaxID=1656885 RepID=UPI0031EDDCD7